MDTTTQILNEAEHMNAEKVSPAEANIKIHFWKQVDVTANFTSLSFHADASVYLQYEKKLL